MKRGKVRIGTAGWAIGSVYAERFPGGGSHLERYARRLDAAEINSSFHRPHRHSTYERWAASVPDDFRFSVKLPKAISHERRLEDCDDLVARFAEEVGGLGGKLGAVLVQLPPSLAFLPAHGTALARLRTRFACPVVCEPRHASWFAEAVDARLDDIGIGRAAADPAPAAGAERPGGRRDLAYFRLHGRPHVYRSPYEPAALATWHTTVKQQTESRDIWVMFDNTAANFALGNALAFRDLVLS